MSRLRFNIVANYAGSAWFVVLSLVFVPVYVKLLGVEAYGLIGFFTSLQILLAPLDLGFSAALTRELARVGDTQEERARAAVLVRTLEAMQWAVAAVIGLGLIALAGPIVRHWLAVTQVGGTNAASALALMGLAIAARWPSSLYSGALVGLERQVLLSAVRSLFETLRVAGAAAVLVLWRPSLEAFLYWQIGSTALGTLCLRIGVWRSLAPVRRPRVDWGALRGIRRYAAGMAGISVTTVVLTQIDKLVGSHVLSLGAFGLYSLAWSAAAALAQLAAPLYTGYMPRLTRLVSASDQQALERAYFDATFMMALVVVPIAVLLAVFAEPVLLLWTRNAGIAAGAAPILAVLVTGMAVNALSMIPGAILLGSGWTRLPLLFNVTAIIVLVPLIYVLATRLGATGVAIGWAALYVANLAIVLPLMHRRLLPGRLRAFYRIALVAPIAPAAVALAARTQLTLPDPLVRPFAFAAAIGGIYLVLLATVAANRRLLRPASAAGLVARYTRCGRSFPMHSPSGRRRS